MKQRSAKIGNRIINIDEKGHVDVISEETSKGSTKEQLRTIAKEIGFAFEEGKETTQSLGQKLVRFLNGNNSGSSEEMANMKICAEPAPSAEVRSAVELERFEENGKYGFKDENGNVVIPCQYDFAYKPWENGFCKVDIDGKEGYIDSSGNVIIPIEYEAVSYMEKGDYFVVSKGKWRNKKMGVLSPEAKMILPIEYDDCDTHWLDDRWVLRKDGASYVLGNGGVIEKKLPYDYYESFDAATNLSLVRRDGKWGYVNKSLEEVVACENQFYVLCVACNPYLLESMPMDADTLKGNFAWLKGEYEYEFKENGLNKAKKLSRDNIGDIFRISERNMFQEYGGECHSYIDEVEQISLAPVAGENWCDEWRSIDHDDDLVVFPDEVDIEYSDYPVIENCIETVYKRAQFACGLFYRIVIKGAEDFDPSKLKVVNSGEGSCAWDVPDVFYDEKPLKLLGNGFDDCEFEYSTARLYWDGEEIELPEKNYGYEDGDEDW